MAKGFRPMTTAPVIPIGYGTGFLHREIGMKTLQSAILVVNETAQ